MNGVTILNTIKEISYTGGITIWTILVILIFGGLAISLIVIGTFDKDASCFILAIGTIFMGFLLGALSYNHGGQPIETYKYQVIVDENVSFKEFTNYYDIVGQEGQIYIVKEKNGNTN